MGTRCLCDCLNLAGLKEGLPNGRRIILWGRGSGTAEPIGGAPGGHQAEADRFGTDNPVYGRTTNPWNLERTPVSH